MPRWNPPYRSGAPLGVLLLGVVAAQPVRAQGARDTLLYSVEVAAREAHLSVEARLTSRVAGLVVLVAPPAAGPAGTTVAGLSATDDRGAPLAVQRGRSSWSAMLLAPGAVRFRYRLNVNRGITDGSTSTGLDTTRFYAVTRSLFVAPDPTAYRKSGRAYPALRVSVHVPDTWRVVAGWRADGDVFQPADGDDLLGSTLAAAPDFRMYDGSAGGTPWRLAIRGRRYFDDSTLTATIRASISRTADLLGPPRVAMVSYTGDLGRKGRTSGSLQGRNSIGLLWEPSEVLELARSHDLFHETLHMWFGGLMESERWWIEGVTDYVAARLYASWQDRPDDLAYLCFQSLRNYQGIEHRTRLTMAEENNRRMGGDNTELLVYRKGMLAGLLLDAAIREGSGNRRSLDDVSRRLLQIAQTRTSRMVREPEIRDAVVMAGGDAGQRAWARVVDGTEPITEDDVATALRTVTGRAFAPPALAKGRKELVR